MSAASETIVAALTPRERWAAYVKLGRPKFLLYSLVTYGLGASVFLLHEGTVDLAPFALGLLFGWCGHLMTHYANEYFDYEADRANPNRTGWTGGSGVLVQGLVPREGSLAAGLVLLFVCLALLVLMPDLASRAIGLALLALAWFYVAPPLRLNYRGAGEVTVAIALVGLGPLLAYRLQGGTQIGALLLTVAPIVLIQYARMLVMNLADRPGDLAVGKRTLAARLGPRRTAWLFAVVQIVAYGSLPFLTSAGVPHAVAWAVALTLPLSIVQTLRLLRGDLADPERANSVVFWASTHSALAITATNAGALVAAWSARGHSVASDDFGRAALLCALPIAAYLSMLGPQILANRRRARA
jgi:1,4-dihydroxy-2-naphthoate octaprenyltransferase